MRRGCFVDSEFSFCSKTCRIKKELALCADFQPAGKRYPAAECVAELADNIKAAVGRLNNMMNNLFVDARPTICCASKSRLRSFWPSLKTKPEITLPT